MDLFSRPLDETLAGAYPLTVHSGCPALAAEVADKIASVLASAQRPLIYVGGGCGAAAANGLSSTLPITWTFRSHTR
jgi:acetolactate synthase-1/2/3 large subunit